MAGGNLFGAIFNSFAFAAIWVFLAPVIDMLAQVFGTTISVLPTLQDAVSGFNMAQLIYGIAVPVIVYLGIWINYFMVEHSEASQEV